MLVGCACESLLFVGAFVSAGRVKCLLARTRVVIIIELLQKRTFEDVLFFCVVKLGVMIGMENLKAG